jgi:Zn-dependent peptidase ImmA (M78 family)
MNTNNTRSDRAAKPEPNIIRELRQLLPVRPLRYHEHLQLAERQTSRLLQLLDQRTPAVDLAWLTELDGVTVVLQPRWQMEGLSGLTTWHDGRWIIGVNKNNSHARRRFTLAHELKHLIDATRDKITYRDITDNQREQIANYFAACYLMPKMWVRRAWTGGIQDPEALAGLFKVSTEAMTTRLTYLGFIDREPGRSLASYFRTELAA